MRACASCARSRRGGLAGADRPDGLVGDVQRRRRLRDGRGDRVDLAAEDGLGLPRLALLQGLADAGDDAEPGLERGVRAARGRLVGLAEVLAALGVADDRAGGAGGDQHRARDLAGERALVLPVDVLRVDADRAALELGDGRLKGHVRRRDHDVDALGLRAPRPGAARRRPRSRRGP